VSLADASHFLSPYAEIRLPAIGPPGLWQESGEPHMAPRLTNDRMRAEPNGVLSAGS
jgi:hypothetical protein